MDENLFNFQVGENGIGNGYVEEDWRLGVKSVLTDLLGSFFISKEWIWMESANNQDPLLPQPLFGCRDKIVAGLEEHVF